MNNAFSSVQLLNHVQLFVTPCTAAHQSSLSITKSQSLLKFISIESVMKSNHLSLCRPVPFFSCVQSVQASGSFTVSKFFTSGGQSIGASASALVLPMNTKDWFPLGLTGLIASQESYPTPQFKSIPSLVLRFLYGSTFTSIHDYWKTHSFDCKAKCCLCFLICCLGLSQLFLQGASIF